MRSLQLDVTRFLLFAAATVLGGCAGPPKAEAPAAEATAACAQGFVEVRPGAAGCGFTLTAAGALLQEGRTLAAPLVVSYQQDAAGSTPIAAGKVVLFPPSPSGRFRILQACESAAADGLCWKVFLFDGQAASLSEALAGKYGPERWQGWSPDERHVALVSRSEGASWIHVVAAPGGESRAFPGDAANENWQVQPETLAWKDPRGFTVVVARCAGCAAAPMEIRF